MLVFAIIGTPSTKSKSVRRLGRNRSAQEKTTERETRTERSRPRALPRPTRGSLHRPGGYTGDAGAETALDFVCARKQQNETGDSPVMIFAERVCCVLSLVSESPDSQALTSGWTSSSPSSRAASRRSPTKRTWRCPRPRGTLQERPASPVILESIKTSKGVRWGGVCVCATRLCPVHSDEEA